MGVMARRFVGRGANKVGGWGDPRSMVSQYALRLSLRPADWAHLISGPSNASAVELVRASDKWPGGVLALIGPEGSGKSYIAEAWRRGVCGICVDPNLVSEGADISGLTGLPLLLEDADQLTDGRGLLSLINLIRDNSGLLLLTARTLPSVWGLGPVDLKSRLSSLPFAEIESPDDAMLSVLLVGLARARFMKLPDDVVQYAVSRMPRSFSAAGAFVTELERAVSHDGRKLTVPTARLAIDLMGQHPLFASEDGDIDDG